MEFINLGIDVGNGYTKYGNDEIFKSRVMIGELSKASERSQGTYEVQYEGLTYIVGAGSEFITSKRHLKDEYLLCILTAIAEKSEEKDVSATICIGVTVETFQNKSYIEKIKEKYNCGKMYNIIFNGEKKNIRINQCAVLTESAYPLLCEDEASDVIVIDVGTGTISVVHWKDKKIESNEFRTYNEGLYVAANKIAKVLKNMYNEDISIEHILKSLGKDTILINQIEEDFRFHKKLMAQHITSVSSKIVTDFRLNEVEKIYVQGGGVAGTINYWNDDFENAEAVPGGQYINAKVYQKYADVLSRKR